jgi:hypothetical protein
MDDFIKLCIMLGTDFNKKTKGVGANNMIQHLDTPLTLSQKKTLVIFTTNKDLEYKDNIAKLKGEYPYPSLKNPALIEYLESRRFKKLPQRLKSL